MYFKPCKIWIDFMHKALQGDGIKEIERPFVEKRTRLPSHTIHVTARWTFGIFCISERILRNFISNSQRRASTEDFPLRFSTKWRLNGQIFWVSLCQEMLQPIENFTAEITCTSCLSFFLDMRNFWLKFSPHKKRVGRDRTDFVTKYVSWKI